MLCWSQLRGLCRVSHSLEVNYYVGHSLDIYIYIYICCVGHSSEVYAVSVTA